MGDRRFSILLTATQTAERLGVPVERVLLWAAEGRLRIAGQDEDGRALFREHIIATVGEDLAALVPAAQRFPRKHRLHDKFPGYLGPPERPSRFCGCNPARSPLHLCGTGAGLLAALQLAEGFAAAAPGDRLLAKLAGLCRDALARHLSGPAAPAEESRTDAALAEGAGADRNGSPAECAEPVRLIPRLAPAPPNETAGREVHVT